MRSIRAIDARGASGFLVVLVVAAIVAGCSALRTPGAPARSAPDWSEEAFARKEMPSFGVDVDARGAPVETVLGETTTYRVRKGDTLLDVARWYDLGYNEIVAANPGVDPWVPAPGTDLVVPTQFVLPCCTYDGIVVNLPEMRLYHYRRSAGRARPGHGEHLSGRARPRRPPHAARHLPRARQDGEPAVEHPAADPPRAHRRARRPPHVHRRRRADNPLGKHRIELANSLYAIHGTNIPWGIGMLVSHGCLRLYPEDIERLFPDVAVGTKVRFVYQPVKAGQRDGAAFVEAHPDVYRHGRSLAADARTALKERGLAGAVDPATLDDALRVPSGVPIEIRPAAAIAPPARAG